MATVPILPVCCVCKHVAPTGSTPSQWMPMSTFLEQQHLRPVDVRFSHTYCPICYQQQAEAWAISAKAGSEETPRAA